jgi:hypothetical protein
MFTTVSLMPGFAFAEVTSDSDDYEIISVNQLEEEISEKTDKNNELTKKEGEEIFSETEPEILAAYIDNSIDIAMEKCNEIVADKEFCLEGENELIIKEDVCEGINMEIRLTDEEESSLVGTLSGFVINSLCTPVYAASGSGSETVTKEYGARRFTATLKLTIATIVFAKLCLVNHYKISSNGLDLTSTDVGGTAAYLVADIPSAKATKTDTVARSEGANIDCEGSYTVKVTIPYFGIPIQTKYAVLMNYVKLENLDKKNKKAKVKQHMTFVY